MQVELSEQTELEANKYAAKLESIHGGKHSVTSIINRMAFRAILEADHELDKFIKKSKKSK